MAAYVWDYADRMAMIKHFWTAAAERHPAAAALDEGVRFPLCRPEALRALWTAAGLSAVRAEPIEVTAVFRDFNDYWQPFLGAQGPAPAYLMSLTEEHRDTLRELLRASLPAGPDGSITLPARAWAVRGQ